MTSVFRLGLSLAAVLLLVPSCATPPELDTLGLAAPEAISISEPEPLQRELLRTDISTATRTALLYVYGLALRGKGDDRAACDSFNSALQVGSQVPDFIRRLLRLRTLQTCATEDFDSALFGPAMNEEVARAKLDIGRRSANRALTAAALLSLSNFEKSPGARIQRLNEALAALGPADNEDLRQKIFERLFEVAPRFRKNPTPSEWMSVANDYRTARDFENARHFFQLIAKNKQHSIADRLKALDGVRQTFKLELKTPEYLAASGRWAAFAEQQLKLALKPRRHQNRDLSIVKACYDAQVQHARAIWTDHRRDEARRVLENVERRIGQEVSVHESKLIRARMEEEAGDLQKMDAILRSIDLDQIPDRATKSKILWFTGWNQRRVGQLETSITSLEKATLLEDSISARARNQYWIGRIQSAQGDQIAAEKTFVSLSEDNQFGVYGMLAQRELRRDFQPLAAGSIQASRRFTDIQALVDWLLVLGESEVGRRYLMTVPSSRLWNPDLTLSERAESLTLFSRLGLYAQVAARLDEINSSLRNSLLKENPELMFPAPYADTIRREAEKHGFEPALTYSVIRQESQFNPFARSPADAFGLMQLIPEMAKIASPEAGVSFTKPEDLFQPEVNIALGSAFLAQLRKKYDNRFILMVAAYNANDRAIQGWLRTRHVEAPDGTVEFIENIPYDETRLYIKLVMRNYIAYRRMTATKPFPFPEELLRL